MAKTAKNTSRAPGTPEKIKISAKPQLGKPTKTPKQPRATTLRTPESHPLTRTGKPRQLAGRPSTYSDDLADEICSRIAAGESIKSITADPHMPGLLALYDWAKDPKCGHYQKMLARARSARADVLVDEMLEIVDATETEEVRDRDGHLQKIVYDSVAVQRARMRSDARKWMASRYNRDLYGDQAPTQAQTGGTPLTGIQIVFVEPQHHGSVTVSPDGRIMEVGL
jgi:hypothetical protein